MTSIARDRPARAETKLLTLISTGHFFSHFYLIVLPPLFPLLEAELGVGYAALGLLLTLPNLASMVLQTPVGFLVDRFGARRPLVIGLIVMAGAVAGAGVVPSYGALVVFTVLMGVGNSVFHPADYAILSARIDPGRLGRAFSIHSFAGNLGWALAPVVVIFLTALWNWHVALIAVGLFGVGVALVILTQGQEIDGRAAAKDLPAANADREIGFELTKPCAVFFLFE